MPVPLLKLPGIPGSSWRGILPQDETYLEFALEDIYMRLWTLELMLELRLLDLLRWNEWILHTKRAQIWGDKGTECYSLNVCILPKIHMWEH